MYSSITPTPYVVSGQLHSYIGYMLEITPIITTRPQEKHARTALCGPVFHFITRRPPSISCVASLSPMFHRISSNTSYNLRQVFKSSHFVQEDTFHLKGETEIKIESFAILALWCSEPWV